MVRRILVLDDDPDSQFVLSASLLSDGYGVETLDTGKKALQRLGEEPRLALLILDLAKAGLGGMETLRYLHEFRRELPLVVLSCLDSPDDIVEAFRRGASDYFVKPYEDSKLRISIDRILESFVDPPASNEKVVNRQPFIALNEKMLRIQETIRQFSQTDVPVFIHGESGVGKEVVARSIHELSDRRDKRFLKINCAALPADLLESELFGYERGAFTGAVASKPGKFQIAHQGTIFLDEISEMPPALQAKLLQVLQDGQFSRLGGKTLEQVDVRVLAATNVNPVEAMKSGILRKDLYYRLTVVNIHVPPLRERMDELEELTQHFLDKYGRKYGQLHIKPSASLLAAMHQYDWPGNIRELENVVRRYIVLHDTNLVETELANAVRSRLEKSVNLTRSLSERTANVSFKERISSLKKRAEAEAILQALNKTNWNRIEASKLLSISYKSLLYRMGVLEIGSKFSKAEQGDDAISDEVKTG